MRMGIDRNGSTKKLNFRNEISYNPFQVTATNLEAAKSSCGSIEFSDVKVHGDVFMVLQGRSF